MKHYRLSGTEVVVRVDTDCPRQGAYQALLYFRRCFRWLCGRGSHAIPVARDRTGEWQFTGWNDGYPPRQRTA